MASNNGWDWVLRLHPSSGRRTHYQDDFDGAYVGACPGCGQDTWWNALDIEPMCTCGSVS